jgi:hypothetical protein
MFFFGFKPAPMRCRAGGQHQVRRKQMASTLTPAWQVPDYMMLQFWGL